MSKADEIFINNCKHILDNGVFDSDENIRARWADGSPAKTIRVFGIVNRYDLSKEFPAMTLRRLAFKNCIDEILWIWQKKSNNINDLNSGIWNSWADENGTIGKAYGYQLGQIHKYAEGDFDQVDRVLYDIKNNPSSRRILTNIYNHNDLHAMGLYPCAYSMTFSVQNGRLSAILNQRSQDFLAANNWNVCQYAILLHMFALDAGLYVGELIHVIADAHIYDRHIPIIKEMIEKPPRPAPTLKINDSVKDFYKFAANDFELLEYKPHPSKDIKFEVAV